MNNPLVYATRTASGLLLFAVLVSSSAMRCQSEAPVPVLTGSVAYFDKVNAGQAQYAPSLSPLILAPLGDKWLLEAKGSSSDTIAPDKKGNYESTYGYGLAYGQIDYIANPYVTVSGGRFTAPFGIYNERLAPNWIKNLQATPLAESIASGSALGGMLRGGFPAGTRKINLNYAAYFSAANTNHIVATNRSSGGRLGFFVPALRLEAGGSFQQLLQQTRNHFFGAHFLFQPFVIPLAVRSEFVRASGLKGSAYWIETSYRLSQIPHGRRFEVVGRAQQFFAATPPLGASASVRRSVGKDIQESDFGVNYYVRSYVRIATSYGREFERNQNSNQWIVGMTYRFVMPMIPGGGAW